MLKVTKKDVELAELLRQSRENSSYDNLYAKWYMEPRGDNFEDYIDVLNTCLEDTDIYIVDYDFYYVKIKKLK